MLSFLKRRNRRGEKPVNYRAPDKLNIDADVSYAVSVVNAMFEWINRRDFAPDEGAVLELGPGYNFGPALILASHGARVSVADRFLAKWDNNYHPAFYRCLLSRWDRKNAAIKAVIDSNSHNAALHCVEEPAESMPSFPDGYFSTVISNAVLEHISDPKAVAKELARVTSIGGINYHQVDFRDHDDFSRPLEFLLMTESNFAEDSAHRFNERGTRLRPGDYRDLFQSAGFDVRMEANCFVDAHYLDEFVPRLRRSTSTRRDIEMEKLKAVCAFYRLERHCAA